jgi:hypothetical protein
MSFFCLSPVILNKQDSIFVQKSDQIGHIFTKSLSKCQFSLILNYQNLGRISKRASLLFTPPQSPSPSRTRQGSKRYEVSGAMNRLRSNIVGKAINVNVNGNLNVNDNSLSTKNRLASALGQVPSSNSQVPSLQPSDQPSLEKSAKPSASQVPSLKPSSKPSLQPSLKSSFVAVEESESV